MAIVNKCHALQAVSTRVHMGRGASGTVCGSYQRKAFIHTVSNSTRGHLNVWKMFLTEEITGQLASPTSIKMKFHWAAPHILPFAKTACASYRHMVSSVVSMALVTSQKTKLSAPKMVSLQLLFGTREYEPVTKGHVWRTGFGRNQLQLNDVKEIRSCCSSVYGYAVHIILNHSL